jgi:DNA-binding response OmpR family regulator
MLKILIVEDEKDFSDALKDFLTAKGYLVETLDSLAAYTAWLHSGKCDLMILDRTLNDGDGLEILRHRMGSTSVPTIFLTGMGCIQERIKGYDLNVDSYLVKPADLNELLAVVQRCLRRAEQFPPTSKSLWALHTDGWLLRSPDNKIVELTYKEFLLMKSFVGLQGLAVKRNLIIQSLGFTPDAYDIRRLEAMVSRLRKKLDHDSVDHFPLTTVYGVGYAFNEEINLIGNLDD